MAEDPASADSVRNGRESEGDDSGPTNEDQARQLRELFVTVTGDERVVTEQDAAASSRHTDASTGEAISEYVTAIAMEDGLGETIDDREITEID